MSLDNIINIKGVDYSFKSDETGEEPLRQIMTVNHEYELLRDIDPDIPFEKWTLVHKYISVRNTIKKEERFPTQVYYGADIKDENFMAMLLEHVLFWIYKDDEQDIRTRER